MMRNLVLWLGVSGAVLATGCADDTTASVEFAIDTDGNGGVDCADLDHVLSCIHHPDASVCAHADVNHDGVVDHEDLHDIYSGLSETGHHCTDPFHQDPADHADHH